MPGFKPKGGGGGHGKLTGGHWATILGHKVYLSGPPGHKGGKVLAGGFPGLTHGKDGTPRGPVKHASSSIPMHPKPGGVKDSVKAVGKVQPPEPDRVQARADRHVRETRKAVDKAKVAHDRAKKELDRHNAGKGPQSPEAKAAGEKLKGLHERHAELGRELDRRKADLAEHDRKIAGLKEKLAGAKAKDATKGVGNPAGKSSENPKAATHPGKPAAPGKSAAHAEKAVARAHAAADKALIAAQRLKDSQAKTDAMRRGSLREQREDHAARRSVEAEKAGRRAPEKLARPSHGQHPPTYQSPAPSGQRTVKTSAPRNAEESAIHADAKARGKAAMIVTSAPQYRAEKSGAQTRHMVGGKVVATHEYKDGKHQVTVHHADGSRSVYRHRDARGAHAHLKVVAGSAIRSGTTRHAVVGSDLSAFDHRAHGIGGEHHRVTARVLGDGKSRVHVRSVHRGPVAGSGFRPKS